MLQLRLKFNSLVALSLNYGAKDNFTLKIVKVVSNDYIYSSFKWL